MAIVFLATLATRVRGEAEEREMDRVPIKGEIVCVGDYDTFYVVKNVFWSRDGHAWLHLIDIDNKDQQGGI